MAVLLQSTRSSGARAAQSAGPLRAHFSGGLIGVGRISQRESATREAPNEPCRVTAAVGQVAVRYSHRLFGMRLGAIADGASNRRGVQKRYIANY
jgi:hypothetical protein